MKLTVKVCTYDGNLTCSVLPKTKAKELLDHVLELLHVKSHKAYFRLCHINRHNGVISWLDDDHDIFRPSLVLWLRIKLYPVDFEEAISTSEEEVLKLLYKQVHDLILNSGQIKCSKVTAIQLASHAAQAHFGDYNELKLDHNYLASWVTSKMDAKTLDTIQSLHQQHRGRSQTDAMRIYLNIAQSLPMYGVEYHKVTLKMGLQEPCKALLGITPWGIRFYETADKPKPTKAVFDWPNIVSMGKNPTGNRIRFRSLDSNFDVMANTPRMTMDILTTCLAYQQLSWTKQTSEYLEDQRRSPKKVEKLERENAHLARQCADLEARYGVLEKINDALKSKLSLAEEKIAEWKSMVQSLSL